jgi:hypothetical protein
VTGRRWWRLGLGGGIVLVLVGIGVAGWTWRHPTAFPEAGGWGVEDERRPSNVPLYVGMTFPGEKGDGSVAVDRADAHVVADTAAADIEVVVCTLVDAESGSVGSASGPDIDELCSTLEPAEDVSLSIDRDPRQQLLVAVTTTRPGRVRIHGIDVTYSHGWQHGTQRVGGDIEVHTIPRQ